MVIFLHKRSELIKQIGTVLRAGHTFGMVLHAEHFGCLVPYALYRVIQQIDVRDLQPRVLKALFVYGIAVVLRGDLNFSYIGYLPRSFLTRSITGITSSGSPGPLDRKMPSGFILSISAAEVL